MLSIVNPNHYDVESTRQALFIAVAVAACRGQLHMISEGVPTRTWTYYYPDGTRAAAARYRCGWRAGQWQEWDSGGAPRAETDDETDC
jgi:hypothetical protein